MEEGSSRRSAHPKAKDTVPLFLDVSLFLHHIN